MYGYIYKTTNIINGKIYIGQHMRDYSEGINSDYFGSGKLIKEAIERYGQDCFKVEIIEWCKTQKEQYERERFWIKELNSLYIYGNYNMAAGGLGGSSVGQKNNLSAKNYNAWGKNNSFYGMRHTQETKDKISNTKKGTVPPNKGRVYTEEEKERWYYNKTFEITCYVCETTFTSHASGSKYCDRCKHSNKINKHFEGIIKILNGKSKQKNYYVRKRVEKIIDLQNINI